MCVCVCVCVCMCVCHYITAETSNVAMPLLISLLSARFNGSTYSKLTVITGK